jgi:hypothetical protein
MAASTWDTARRWLSQDERAWLFLLYALVVAGAVFLMLYPPSTAIVLVFPLLLATLFLSPRRTTWLAVSLLVVLALETMYSYGVHLPARRVVSFGFAIAMCLLVIVVAQRRATLGVAGVRTDAMLTDLRERLGRQGVFPDLPPGWYADVAIRSAGSTQFAGDFLVTRKSLSEDRLDLAVVDVSGKGVEAGPKSLLLSGAFGALIQALAPQDFLTRANDFVVDQDWEEGFATAIHISLNLRSGEFCLWSAGHPPAVHFKYGSGTWKAYEDIEGPALGLIRSVEYKLVEGTLHRGDALLLFTDGLIEESKRDLSIGLDTLLGEGERLLHRGFDDTAQPLVDKLGAVDDDCALVVLHRRS